jgi:hypothetical protein
MNGEFVKDVTGIEEIRERHQSELKYGHGSLPNTNQEY